MPSIPFRQSAPGAMQPRVLTAVLVTLLAWASAFLVIRSTGTHFSAGALALARLLVAAVPLAYLASRQRWVAPTRWEWTLLVTFGVSWFGAYNLLLNLAEQTLDAGTAALIVNIGPVLIAVGAAAVLREPISRWLGTGMAVAFVGVLIIAVGNGATGLAVGWGAALAASAAAVYAVGVLAQKPTLRRLPPAQVTFLGCVFGSAALLPFVADLLREGSVAPLPAVLGAVYLGLVPTALAFSTWAFALSHLPASQLGVTTYLVPPLVIVLSAVLLAEVPSGWGILGGIVCLFGVALSRRRPPGTARRARGPVREVAPSADAG